MEEKGADVITIAGFEVAGHPSTDGIGTMILANKVASSAVCPFSPPAEWGRKGDWLRPWRWAAEGVVMGTRFVATAECPFPPP
jgi:nitronate monooxygenase